MARGITENDVWTACDALLLEGSRPTIERVRQKIGRGSPNTVSPMLETWFSRLGARIKDPGAFSAPPSTPEPILQVANHLWEVAQAESRRDFDQRVRDEMAAVESGLFAERAKAARAESAAAAAALSLGQVQAELDQLRKAFELERIALQSALAQNQLIQRRCRELQTELSESAQKVNDERSRADQAIAAADMRALDEKKRSALLIDKEHMLRVKAERTLDSTAKRLEAALMQQAGDSQKIHTLEERVLLQSTEYLQREKQMQAGSALLAERVQSLEASLQAANLALSRAAAQDVLVAQIVAKLDPHQVQGEPQAPRRQPAKQSSKK